MGSHITNALLKQGKHKITAITRPNSANVLPEGIHFIQKVDYDDQKSLSAAMQDIDALIITISALGARDSQTKLIDAAIEAGVKYIMPNEWGLNISDSSPLVQDLPFVPEILGIRKYIEEKGQGKTKWVALSCSFWYEFSLAGTEIRFGFDFTKKSLTLFDEGNVKICTTTWPQVGRAVARLFALPIATLSQWDNQAVLVNSFTLSQRDMLESVLRVTGERQTDWTIISQSSKERFQDGIATLQGGNVAGVVKMMYTRVFFPDASQDFQDRVQNEQLGLPVEELDDATRVAIEMAKNGPVYGF